MITQEQTITVELTSKIIYNDDYADFLGKINPSLSEAVHAAEENKYALAA